jgi:NAD(P)-dependent dehydrogenase (short-subunit alcohol dehydrogenase family)
MSRPLIVVVGAGPGVGAAVCHRFCAEGYDVGLVARSAERLEELARDAIAAGAEASCCPVDITDSAAFTTEISRLGAAHGRIDHLHFNPSVTRMADPMQLSPEQLLHDVRVGVASLLTAVQAARPFMTRGGRITATGSMTADQAWAEAASLGVQKAGLRNLVDAIDLRLRPDGIRAVSVTVRGLITPGTEFDPGRIAAAVLGAARQSERDWRSEVPYPDGTSADPP